jgi:2-phospho-L-lactate guanylyltransferase
MTAMTGADLSRLVGLIPVRSLSDGKSRLGEPLDAEERAALVVGLLRRTVDAAKSSRALAGLVVVSMDAEILDEARRVGAETILQVRPGLNEGLAEARLAAAGATAILVLPADLPDVSAGPIVAIAEAARAEAAAGPNRPVVVLVPDQHGSGTNALLVSPPDAIDFAFGEESRTAHALAARRAGACYLELPGPLSFDVDTAEDLLVADLRGLDHDSGR